MFVIGLALGSFLNVGISRIPRDLSVVTPSSRCPQCGASIRWRDNIPVLSWLLLHGRCRQCGATIPWRYPAVELLTAVLFLACYGRFGLTWLGLKACVLCFLVPGLIFMDAETGLLPREFTYTGTLAGLALAWKAAFDPSGTVLLLRVLGVREIVQGPRLWFTDATAGAAAGAGFFYLAWALYYLVRKRAAVGWGDIAMLAMLGAFLGLKLELLVIFLSPLLATLFSIGGLLPGRGVSHTASVSGSDGESGPRSLLAQSVPFGVYLGCSALLALLWGERIWNWYLRTFF